MLQVVRVGPLWWRVMVMVTGAGTLGMVGGVLETGGTGVVGETGAETVGTGFAW